MSISVIVPFFNEARIGENIAVLEEELRKYFHKYEIILVSDGSTDDGEKRAKQHASSQVKVFHYPKNQGKGFAIKYGFEQSSGEYVAFIDGGMELHPQDIKRFLALMDIYDADIVIGSKRHTYSEVHYPLMRRILSRLYQVFISLFLQLNVRDTQVGLKLFKRKVLEKTLPKVLVKKYAFDLELLTVAKHLGFTRILEAPIKLDFSKSYRKNFLADMAHTMHVAWPLLWDTLAIIYRLRILHYYDK